LVQTLAVDEVDLGDIIKLPLNVITCSTLSLFRLIMAQPVPLLVVTTHYAFLVITHPYSISRSYKTNTFRFFVWRRGSG